MKFITLASFVFFTGLVGFITWRLTRRDSHDTSEGYFLGGRSLTAGFIAGSLILTNLSTEQMVGLNGAAFNDGLSVMAWEVLGGVSLVLMALVFLPVFLRSGIATVPQFLELRFDAGTRAITTLIFVVAYTGILLPIILYTGATGLMGILDIPGLLGIQSETTVLWLVVWLIGLIGSVYAIFGGLRTVAVSDTINGIGLLIGGILITVLGLSVVNDNGIFAALTELRQANPEKLNSLGAADQSVPFSTLFSGVLLLNLFYWCTNQQIIQRTLGAASLAEGQKGVLLAGFLKILAPLILVLPGIIAFHLYASQQIRPDHAYGALVREVLPDPLAGFFAAVMVGAILSSFNSALNSTATLFSLGVYKPMIAKNASERAVIHAGKVFAWVISIFAMCMAPLLAGQVSIYAYLQKMNGLYFMPILSVVLIGMFTKRVPAIAAKLALVTGFSAIAIGYFVPAAAAYAGMIHEFHFLGIVFISLIGLMLLIGYVRPEPDAWHQASSHAVDMTPWAHANKTGILLALAGLSIFLIFADTSVL